MSVVTTGELPVLVVRTAADLAALRSGGTGPRWVGVRLDLPGIGDEEARRSAERIATLRNECGCMAGARLALSTVCAMGVWLAVGAPYGPEPLVQRIGIAMTAVVAAVLLGKGVGVMRARYRLRREIDWVSRQMHP